MTNQETQETELKDIRVFSRVTYGWQGAMGFAHTVTGYHTGLEKRVTVKARETYDNGCQVNGMALIYDLHPQAYSEMKIEDYRKLTDAANAKDKRRQS